MESVESTYAASVAGTALGSTMAAGVGGFMVIMVYFISIPALIVGFVLLLKRKVWKCGNCGYIFDRALSALSAPECSQSKTSSPAGSASAGKAGEEDVEERGSCRFRSSGKQRG